jgi:hypothetical protein
MGVENWVVDEQYAAMHVEAKAGRYGGGHWYQLGTGFCRGGSGGNR